MFIVIINAESGNGKALKLFKAIQTDPLFKSKNCRTFLTEYAGHAEKIAEQVVAIHREAVKCMIVIGEDGTLNEVLNGIAHYPSLPLAYIPAGTGNSFARGIGIKRKGVSLFRRIVNNPELMNIRTGSFVTNQRHKYGRRLFANSIGFGLDGEMAALVNHSKYGKWLGRLSINPLSYIIALLLMATRLRPIAFELEIDGKVFPLKHATMVTIANHPYNGGMNISPRASIHNPKFNILIIGPISRWKLLGLFLTVFIGKHTKFKEVVEIQGEFIRIRSENSISFQFDGQSGECYECEIRKSTNQQIIHVG